MDKITIAIDGHSSTGKSTIAKELAKALSYLYVDSGAMYRAVTLFALRHSYIDFDMEDTAGLVSQLDNIELKFQFNSSLGFSEMYLNGENVENEIRTLEVSKYVSKIAEIPEVRMKLVEMQQEMGKEKGIVMDGRDIGTVVFPEAELKIFITASSEIRALRRYKELLDRGEEVSFNDVLNNVRERDFIDSHRKHSPLKKSDDAVIIDNGALRRSQQFDHIHELALEIIAAQIK